jgi:hypothetical protein
VGVAHGRGGVGRGLSQAQPTAVALPRHALEVRAEAVAAAARLAMTIDAQPASQPASQRSSDTTVRAALCQEHSCAHPRSGRGVLRGRCDCGRGGGGRGGSDGHAHTCWL